MILDLSRKTFLTLAFSTLTSASTIQAQTPPMPRGPGGPPRIPEFPEAKAIPQPKNDEELAAAIRKLAEELAAAGKFSGSVLLAANDRLLVDGAWGEADREHKIENTPDTAFDIGSIGKLFTQIAILQLAETGKLNLDETFGKYLRDYPNPEVSGKVTIRQLLLHTGGIPDAFADVKTAADLKAKKQLKDFLPLFAQRPLEFAPGSTTRYSSSGYIILGLVIEALSGKDYQIYVKEKILEPAGMTHSGFFDRERLPSTVARSYDDGNDVTDAHPARGTSAGGLQASARDLFQLVQSINAGKLIDKESVKLLRGMVPSPPNAPPPSNESKLFGYGIAGGAPGVSAQLNIDSTGHYVRIVLCNSSPPMAMAMSATIRSWIEHLPK
jgi:CubicO group peptidase (beta-lactamase class C family)